MKFHVSILHDSKVTEGDRPTDGRTDRPTDGPTKWIVEILAGSKNTQTKCIKSKGPPKGHRNDFISCLVYISSIPATINYKHLCL